MVFNRIDYNEPLFSLIALLILISGGTMKGETERRLWIWREHRNQKAVFSLLGNPMKVANWYIIYLDMNHRIPDLELMCFIDGFHETNVILMEIVGIEIRFP